MLLLSLHDSAAVIAISAATFVVITSDVICDSAGVAIAPQLLLLLLHCLSPSGRAGPLPIKGNKLLGSLGYRSNPQGALLQAEWLRAKGEVGAV